MKKLSVVISAYNEEKKIEECLKSAKFADEIIVVDNSSTDKTKDLAKKYTNNIFTQPNDPEKIDLQKNFGFEKATGAWILSLDADERVSEELKYELASLLDHPKPAINGYWIPRKNRIFGKLIEHTGWYPDPQLRLFKRGMGKFESEHVHEHIKIKGEKERLTNHLIHENYETVSQFIKKTIVYAENEAKDLINKGYNFSFFDAIRFPLKEFLSRFFAREGYKDGFHGLMLSLLMAFYHFLIFAHIWEIEGYKRTDGDKLLKKGKKELLKIYKEINYWIINTEIKRAKSISKRILLKVKRKIS